MQCTYGNLGEPTRLRRADTENEKLRTIINHALQAETAEEKDDILATITEKMLAASSGGAGKSRKSSEIPDDSSHIPAKRFKEDKEDVDAPSSPVSTAPPPPGETTNHKPAHPSLLATAQADSRQLLGVPSPRPSSDDETTAQFTQALITSEQDRGRGDSELERHVSYFLSVAMPGGDMQDARKLPFCIRSSDESWQSLMCVYN